jgi:hypothetical protein
LGGCRDPGQIERPGVEQIALRVPRLLREVGDTIGFIENGVRGKEDPEAGIVEARIREQGIELPVEAIFAIAK